MNCLDFHREKLASPRSLSDAARVHARDCPRCAAFARRVDEGEARIEGAMLVTVPEGLAERILLRWKGVGRPAWRAWAIAAGVMLCVGLVASYLTFRTADQYARNAIEHVMHEPESFTAVQDPRPDSVAVALKSVGGTLKAPFGRLTYVKLCPLEDGGNGWHLVFDTPLGLATVIFVPDRQLRWRSQSTENGWTALVQPVRHGYYAVVASSAATTSEVASLLKTHVDWNT